MRKHFEQQLSVDIIPIQSVKIPDYKRDELPPTLKALQYIFVTPELNHEVFSILEDAIGKDKKKTGRTGMDLWQILVLGVVRLTLDINYDRLWYEANHDKLVRQIMGIESTDGFREVKEIPYNTIRENVSLLDEKTIEKINVLVVKAGHKIVKKKKRN
jgi:transposase, IS5 family